MKIGKKTREVSVLGLIAVISLLLCAFHFHKRKTDTEKALDYCDRQVRHALKELRDENGNTDYTMIPWNIVDSLTTWYCPKAFKKEWCSSFWSGMLWYDYEYTGDETIRKEAEKFTASLGFLTHTPVYDHDLGLLVLCSYGNAYRLTGDKRYKRLILNVADSLGTLFNPHVGTFLSQPRNASHCGGHNTTMDNMMNLEIFFWAAQNDGNPYLGDMAVSHAEKMMKYQSRLDTLSRHVAVYTPLTGNFIKEVSSQNYADSFLWACKRAWDIYGYTMVYRETHDCRYLEFVQRMVDVYLGVLPEDYIPYLNFNTSDIPDMPRYTSAACVVASALLELSTYVPYPQNEYYKKYAVKLLSSLGSLNYRCGKKKMDASTIYADYYYMEALLRLRKMEQEGKGEKNNE